MVILAGCQAGTVFWVRNFFISVVNVTSITLSSEKNNFLLMGNDCAEVA
jgi:hypothetical protein